MKQIKSILILSAAAMVMASCGSEPVIKGKAVEGISQAQIDSVSYAIGVSLGSMVKSSDFGPLNFSEMDKGMKDVLSEKTLSIDQNQAGMIIQTYMMKRSKALIDMNKAEGAKFLTANKSKAGVQSTESGLQYRIDKEGTGISPEATDTVEVNYRGTLLDGTEFDSSYERGETTKFPLNQVIKGWTEGIQFAKEGGKITLYVPSELAYGPQQAGAKIGPNSTLIFEVELVKVAKTKKK